jgi:hypothetical protein
LLQRQELRALMAPVWEQEQQRLEVRAVSAGAAAQRRRPARCWTGG